MAGRGSSQIGAAKNAVSLRTVDVPEPLQKGEKFIKWDENKIKYYLDELSKRSMLRVNIETEEEMYF